MSRLKSFAVVIVLALIGTIFLAGGLGSTLNHTMTTATCEACGMEVEKSDISSSLVVASDQTDHWACCPICADVIALYYQDAEIQAECFACGKEIDVHLKDGQISYVDYSGNKEFIKIIAGGACMKNKLVCSSACAQTVHETYEWASDIQEKNLKEALAVGNTKLETMTVSYRPISIPALNYLMIAVSVVLLSMTPIAWKLMNKKPRPNLPNE